MARLDLPGFDGPYPQFYSIFTKSDGTPLGQVRKAEVADKISTTKAGRIGSPSKKTLLKTKEPTYSLDIWTDLSDLQEIAVVLNATATPSSGETLKLDPNVDPIDLLIKNYDSSESDATLLSTIYLYQGVPTEFKLSYDEDGEQVASVSGDLQDLYYVVA